MQEYTVESAIPKINKKAIIISDHAGRRITLLVHRFAMVGKGDRLWIDPNHTSSIFVLPPEAENDKIRITPHFELMDSLRLGDSVIDVKLREILSAEDLENHQYLENFHYKTSSAILNSEDGERPSSIGGRKGVLICYIKNGNRWQAAGYIELHMPLMMVKPRHLIFDNPFRHPDRPIEWDKWDQHSIRRFVNIIVRIARVVVSPEVRGLGIAKMLIKAAKKFACERWHVGGRRPIFIEISAEMLKYLDFVSSSGLRYIGDTEGNLERVYKDLKYMQRGYDIKSGIMTLQKKYLTRLKKAADSLDLDFQHLLEQLEMICQNPKLLNSLGPSEYYLFKLALRVPIPYFLGGLDEASNRYIETILSSKSSPHDFVSSRESFKVNPTRIEISDLSVSSQIELPETPNVKIIMDCFGLKGTILSTKLVGPISLRASGGNIIFISGPSGSGKSVLLKALDPNCSEKLVLRSTKESNPFNYTAGWLKDIESESPIIEYFAERWGMTKALSALNQAGLSEAFIYLKPYKLLSRGQKYRAKLAELLIRTDHVWLIDEFCNDLDPLTAKIVARNLRKNVIKHGRIAFVAAANFTHYLDALRPTRILVLRQGHKAEIMSYKDYTDEFYIAAI
jgi:ABC-type ATPase with predicted acetyltransferase domain